MRRVTADTNILVSALIYKRGKPFQRLRMALEGEIRLAVSAEIIAETLDVLSRKFGIKREELPEYKEAIESAASTVHPTVELNVIKHDPPDNRILECAVSSGSEFILTGDKDLLRLGNYDSIRIVTVAAFLEAPRPER